MGNFFGSQAAGERSALGLPIDGKADRIPPHLRELDEQRVGSDGLDPRQLPRCSLRAATLMAQTLTPDSQQAGWISDLQSGTHHAREVGQASVTQPVLSPNKLTTYSAPASSFPRQQPAGYQLNDNWSYFVGDTTGGLTIESYAVNAGAPSLTRQHQRRSTFPTSAQARYPRCRHGCGRPEVVRSLCRGAHEGRTQPLPRGHRRQRHEPRGRRAIWTAPEKVYKDVIN